MIPTRVHAIIDYVVGALLVAAPWIFNFADNRPATLVPVMLGLGIIIYSLLTDYEYSAMRVIPMGLHLMLDFLGGLLLLASPWLFGFADRVTWPHVTVGIMEIGVVLLTQRASRARLHDTGEASIAHA